MKQGAYFSTYKWLVAFIVFLSFPFSAFAASLISVSSVGADIFDIKAANMKDVAAIELTLSYDTAALSNPRFTEGPLISGAMTAVNLNIPGTIKIAIIRTNPVNGSGTIATLRFDLIGGLPGKINSMNAKLANINGSPLTVQVQVNNPPDMSAGNTTLSQTQDGLSSGINVPVAPAQPLAPIIIAGQSDKTEEGYAATDVTSAVEQDDKSGITEPTGEPIKERDIPAKKTDIATSSGETATDANVTERKTYSQKSVLERFKEYRGERTAKAFIALFNNENMNGSRQEPPIALSDGKTMVKAVFTASPGDITPSDIAIMGAKLVSLNRAPSSMNMWIIELIPDKSGYNASFTLSQGEAKTVYPLTIAPKVNIKISGAKTVSKADFHHYLSAKKAGKSKKYDLNGDGKRDYLDDYIFTANYLVSINKGK